MSRWSAYGLSLLARLLSTLSAEYALWLCRRLSAGDGPRDFPKDLRAFARWLLQASATQLCQPREERYLSPRYPEPPYPQQHFTEESFGEGYDALEDDRFPR